MILRQLRKLLLERVAIGTYLLYALGEIILIVTGIYIAVKIEGKYQESEDRKTEAFILQTINEEFRENRRLLNNTLEGHRMGENSSYWLLNKYPNYKDRDSLYYHIRGFLSFYTFDPSQSSIRSLINNSQFDLISNPELRKKLITWHDIFEDFKEDEIATWNYSLDYLIPTMNKHMVRDKNKDTHDVIDLVASNELYNAIYFRIVQLKNLTGEASDEPGKVATMIDDIIRLTNKPE